MEKQRQLFNQLAKLEIPITTYEHEPVFSLEEVAAYDLAKRIPGAQAKSLFLKDDKKRLWMIVVVGEGRINLKQLAKDLSAPALRFGKPDLLLETLGVTPGTVSPFALINDLSKEVHVVLDEELFSHELAGFHPLDNSKTTTIAPDNLKKFIHAQGNPLQVLGLPKK